ITKEEPLPISQYSSLGGTIGNRQVLHEPKSPEIELDKDIEIEVKFFVLPNGRVREVIPVIKGDTHLESIAIQYMKSWIFVPLPKNVEQVEQWGKLKIKFKKVTTN
ncbi:MAG: energy transducer TonB, partial [Candidatus Firestonebacteria bacterium]|nr:energy transducer TonB [Candidatus Firestonebacteria bacterium]